MKCSTPFREKESLLGKVLSLFGCMGALFIALGAIQQGHGTQITNLLKGLSE